MKFIEEIEKILIQWEEEDTKFFEEFLVNRRTG